MLIVDRGLNRFYRCRACGHEYATLAEAEQHVKEHGDGTEKADDQKGQAGQNGGVQEGRSAFGLEGRPEGERPTPGDSNRALGERAKYEEEVRRAQEEAERRDLLGAPYKVRVEFWNGTFLNVDCVIPWKAWLENIREYRGMAFDKGFIPITSIKLIVHIDALGNPLQAGLGENVVPFRRPPA